MRGKLRGGSTHNMHLTSPLSGRHFCSEAFMVACEAV